MDGERGWIGQRWRCKKRRGNKVRLDVKESRVGEGRNKGSRSTDEEGSRTSERGREERG